MDCLMIFDNLNDLLYTKYNKKFGNYIKDFAISQGLLPEDDPDCTTNSDVFIQIFSPVVTSHRIMHCQFGNSYTTILFHDCLSVTFSECMGYLFMAVNDGSNGNMKNYTQMCITFARYLCGPNIDQLRAQESKSTLLTNLIDQWLIYRNSNQAILVEAVEQLVVNNDITSVCLQSLMESVTELAVHTECSKVHALLLVQDKFLSLYSSANAKQLSPADILFTTILTHCEVEEGEEDKTITSYQVLLNGPEQEPKCLPHAVHIVKIFEHVFLVFLVELGNPLVSAALYETFHHVHTLQFVQIQREQNTIQLGYENVELAVKRLNDSLKKAKINAAEASYRKLMKKWDFIKSKYREYLKNSSDVALLRAETLLICFLDDLKELLTLTSVDDSVLACSSQHVEKVIPKVKSELAVFSDFFHVKGIKNFSLGSGDSLTIYKYLEEFPGLVHFLYVDRNTHRVTTPSLDMEAEEAEFIKQKIWFMIAFAQSHLQEDHTSIIWKDKIFTYGYFFWFEDSSGGALKTTQIRPNVADKIPGVLREDYYLKLKTSYFPKMSPSKIKCYELFCMHLGLMTAAGVLEQTRRLAATIWNLKGFPTHAIDLL